MSLKRHIVITSHRLAQRLVADPSGVAAVITALGFVALLGFAGLAIDVGKWLNEARNVQSAADQGAFSAAAAAGTAGCPNDAANRQAKAVVAADGYIDGESSATVSVSCNATNSTFTVAVSKVEPMWFTRLFLSRAPTVHGQATAQLAGRQSDLCILALDGTDFYEGVTGNDASAFWLNGNTNVNVHCGVAIDSSNVAALSTGGSSSLTATDIYIVGDKQGSPSGSSVISTSPTPNNILTYQRPVADPYAGRVVPSYTCGSYSMTTWTASNLTQSSSSSGASAHTFCGGLTLGSNSGQTINITVAPGVYIVAGGSLTFNSKANVDASGGVTFILTGDSTHGYATVTVNGQSTVKLVAPTSGAYGGMAFFQDRRAPSGGSSSTTTSCGSGNSQNQINGGNNTLLTGAAYFPNQSVCWGGGSATSGAGKCTQLIAHTLSFTGNSTINSDCAGTGISAISVTTPELIK